MVPASSPRVLVTGASGFVGGYVSSALEAHGLAVRRAGRRPRSVPGYVAADLTHRGECDALVSGIDAIVHCAGLAHQFQGGAADADYRRVNVVATERLIEAAHNAEARRVVLMSSSSVYGAGKNGASEDAPLEPQTPYGRSKRDAELVARRTCADAGIALTILRPATVYGVGDPGNVRRLIEAISTGRFAMIGSGKNRKSLLAVEDLAEAVRRVLAAPTSGVAVFNVAAPSLTIREVVDAIADATGRPRPRPVAPAELAHGVSRALSLASLGRGPLARLERSLAKWLSDDTIDGRRFAEEFGGMDWKPFGDHVRREAAWLRAAGQDTRRSAA